jgi:hypothetical protein
MVARPRAVARWVVLIFPGWVGGISLFILVSNLRASQSAAGVRAA